MAAEIAAADRPPQLELDFAPDAHGVTRVTRRRVRYPYTFLKPFWFGDAPRGIATVLLQSGSGGLYGGEQLAQRYACAPGAAVHVTTQAAAVAHAAGSLGMTRQRVDISLAADTYCEYLPELAILFPGAALRQLTEIQMASDAVLIHADGVVSHDPCDRQRPFAHYASEVTIRDLEGRLRVRDALAIDGADFDRMLMQADVQWRACGLLLAAAPSRALDHAAWSTELNALLGKETDRCYVGVGCLPTDTGIACRVLARDGCALRDALTAAWRHLRLMLTGAVAPRARK